MTTQANIAFPRRHGTLIAAIATIACCDIAMGLTFQLLPLLMEARKVPTWIMGLNAAMGPIGILLAGPFLPRVIAKIGSKRTVAIVIVAIILGLAAFQVFPSIAAWFVIRFFFGIAAGTLFTISEAWILTATDDNNRGRIMGLYTTILSVSFAVGPAIIPFTGINGRTPWVIGMVCVAMSALPLIFVSVSETAYHDEHGGSFRRFITKAPLLLFAVGAVTIFDSILLSFFPIFGLRSGLSLQTTSWVLGAGIIGNTLFQLPVGMLVDKWSRMGVVIWSSIITIITCIALIWAVNTWAIWPVVIIMASAAFSVYTVSLVVMGDTFKGPDLIAGSAAFSAMWGIGGLVGPPIAGAAIDLFGINAFPVSLASVYVILLIGLALTGGRLIRSAAP